MPPKKLKDLAVGRRDLFSLSINDIEFEDGFNLRQSYETPDDLALRAYIQGGGELPPVVGSKIGAKFRLTDGHRRLFQCQILRDTVDDDPACRWMRLDCQPESAQRKITAAERIARMLAANQGKPFTMWEQAQGYRRYRDCVLGDAALSTHESMAAQFGCTRTHVEDCLLLVDAGSADLQHAIGSDQISATLAVKLIRRTDGHDAQNAALAMAQRNAKEGGDGRRITEKHFGDTLQPKPRPTKKTKADPPDPPDPSDQTDPPQKPGTNQEVGYDSSIDGDYEVTDPEIEREHCDTCEKPLSESQIEAGDTTCWRCQKTSQVQPDDNPPPAKPAAKKSTSSNGGSNQELGTQNPAPSPWEPPVTLDMTFFRDLVDETKPLSNDRRQTMAYLRAHLEGQITRGHLVQWIREGKIDP